MRVPSSVRLLLFGAVLVSSAIVAGQQAPAATADAIWNHRNLGKAFYENPTTQQQAVDEFKAALDLAPGSARERVNYGLALLRAGKTDEGAAQLLQAQKQDPQIPHTWFNLGIVYKKASDYARAVAQFEQMVKLVPNEAVSHYNLGVLYRLTEKPVEGLREFELAAKLDPALAGPHFQLFNAYRAAGRAEEAAREQTTFQEIRKRQTGAAIPEDLDWSYFAEVMDPQEPVNANDDGAPVPLTFDDRAVPSGSIGNGAGRLLVADVDADGRPDVVAWSAAGVKIFRNGDTEMPPGPLAEVKGVRIVSAGDFNNDGYPDLCVIADSGVALFQNNKGRFERRAATLPAGPFNAAVWLDYDHDYDVDLFLVGATSALLRNGGQAGFADQTSAFPFVEGIATGAIVFDQISDAVGRDVLVTYANRAPVLYKDVLGGKFEARPIEVTDAVAGQRPLVAADVDYDNTTDVVLGNPSGMTVLLNRMNRFEPVALTPADGRAAVLADFENRGVRELVAADKTFRNRGSARFTPYESSPIGQSIAIAASDFDLDGRVDLAVIRPDGALHLLRNTTATKNNWIGVSLVGVKNLVSAAEAHVEIKAGAIYQKRAYEGVPLTFGLSGATQVDTVRITWPNGLVQNEVRQPGGKTISFKEAPRLSGSCPMIFTWNGSGFQFITDVLGVAPLGASAGDGAYFPVDHDEYIQIPGSALALKDNAYEIRITEELREVAYLDQVQLIALDHPSDVEIFTNDKFKAPPFPEFRLFGASRRIYPVAARDGAGRDVRAAIAERDRRYAEGFKRNLSGVAELHTLDLDFGQAASGNNAVLILNGWVDWADGSTFLGASQEDPRGLIFPSLQVKDARGEWQTVVADMGIPAGKPKTIAVDLTGKFLSASREVRIVTNLCLYWDDVFLIDSSSAPPAVLTPMNATTADLQFRGFSTPQIDPERRQPEAFDYARLMPLSNWNPTPGLYTRYGDVTPLMQAPDDRMNVMGSGDELRLTFPSAGLPPLPTGWTRDFLLLVDGWAKDADANTAFSQSVEPLPFHTMSVYPYPSTEKFPDDALHRDYRERYNTRPALRLIRPLNTALEDTF
jgi:Tfp pilus assembly protein PilF